LNIYMLKRPFHVEVMEHRRTNEKNAEGQEKEEPRKGKHLSFGRRASVKKQETKDYIIIACCNAREKHRHYNLQPEKLEPQIDDK